MHLPVTDLKRFISTWSRVSERFILCQNSFGSISEDKMLGQKEKVLDEQKRYMEEQIGNLDTMLECKVCLDR